MAGYFADAANSWTETGARSRELLGAAYPYVRMSILSGWTQRHYCLIYDGPRGHCVSDQAPLPDWDGGGPPEHANCRSKMVP